MSSRAKQPIDGSKLHNLRLLSIRECAEIFGVCRYELRAAMEIGSLPFLKHEIAGRMNRQQRDQVERKTCAKWIGEWLEARAEIRCKELQDEQNAIDDKVHKILSRKKSTN